MSAWAKCVKRQFVATEPSLLNERLGALPDLINRACLVADDCRYPSAHPIETVERLEQYRYYVFVTWTRAAQTRESAFVIAASCDSTAGSRPGPIRTAGLDARVPLVHT